MLAQSLSAAVLMHRYPFETNANDVVGGADGVLQGNAVISQGALKLAGTNGSVALPNNLLSYCDSLSLELWFVDDGSVLEAVLFNFGGTNGSIRCLAIGEASYSAGQTSQKVIMPMPVPGTLNQLVWTQSGSTRQAGLYLNGVLMAQHTNFTLTPAQVGTTTNSLIGAGDSLSVFKGSILEFRIYEGALTPLEVALHHASGPDAPDPAPGQLQQLRLVVPAAVGPGALLPPGVFADYQDLTNVNIAGLPELALFSDNTNVIAIKTVTNRLFPFLFSTPYVSTSSYTNLSLLTTSWRLRSVGTGTVHLTAAFLGVSNTVPMTVEPPQVASLIHRYSFDEPAGSRIAHDSLGDAHGRVIATSATATFTGDGELSVGINAAGLSQLSHVRLPPGLISCESEITVETWLTYQGPVLAYSWLGWARVFDFGDQDVGYGKSYFFMTPRNDSLLPRFAVSSNGIAGEKPILNWPFLFHSNVLVHVAATYSPARRVAKLYINGGPPVTGTATTPLAIINDMNNWLGRAQFSQDPYLKGRYDEFRIYRGVLEDSDIAADYAAGPDVVRDFVLNAIAAGSNLTITWGPSAAGWILESSPTLSPSPTWNEVAVAPVFQDGRFRASVPVTGTEAYFRLRKP